MRLGWTKNKNSINYDDDFIKDNFDDYSIA